jgi:hypothetical protein
MLHCTTHTKSAAQTLARGPTRAPTSGERASARASSVKEASGAVAFGTGTSERERAAFDRCFRRSLHAGSPAPHVALAIAEADVRVDWELAHIEASLAAGDTKAFDRLCGLIEQEFPPLSVPLTHECTRQARHILSSLDELHLVGMIRPQLKYRFAEEREEEPQRFTKNLEYWLQHADADEAADAVARAARTA